MSQSSAYPHPYPSPPNSAAYTLAPIPPYKAKPKSPSPTPERPTISPSPPFTSPSEYQHPNPPTQSKLESSPQPSAPPPKDLLSRPDLTTKEKVTLSSYICPSWRIAVVAGAIIVCLCVGVAVGLRVGKVDH
ncbi:hypothetical protein ACLMJK_004009 [Lecanora helva]